MNPEPRLHQLIPTLAIAALFAAGFPALSQYNITWDEALGDLFFGERYLSFFTTFDPVFLDPDSAPYPPDRRPDLSLSPFKTRPWEYYPFANTLAAASSAVFSRWLGWVDPLDGFHAVNLFFAAILIWVLFSFLAKRLGLVTATAAIGFLFTSPRIVCHLMANIKDFPLMVLFAVTAIAFFRAYEAGSVRGLLAAGVLWGLTLATKANALFFPAVPLAVVFLGRRPDVWRGRHKALGLGLLGAAAVGVTVMVAAWPYLWADPIGRFREHLEYIGFRKDFTRPESLAPVFEAVLFTTPPLFLLLFAVGLVPAAQRAWRRDRLAILLLVWAAVPLGRYLLPQAVNFDGVRHFLELFPAMAAIAGLGVAWIGQQLASTVPRYRQQLKAVLLMAALLPGAWQVLRTHPFQIAYWNILTGGYAGARAANQPQAGDYWGMSYRLGLRWLTENAPQNALLAVPVIEHAVRLVASERLRPDIQLLPVTTPFSPRIAPQRLAATRELAQRRPVYVMFVERRDWLNELMVDCLRSLEPEVVWELEGSPVLSIYRYQWPLPES